jgi:hypothetical protein
MLSEKTFDCMVLVLSAPRSGSRYITKVLQRAGMQVAHENIGKDGAVNPTYFSYVKAPVVLHQVRHPFKAIASLVGLHERGRERFAVMHGFHANEFKTLEGAAFLWARHNRWCEGHDPCMRYRVEDVDSAWTEIAGRLGMPDEPFPKSVPRNVGHHSSDRGRWPEPVRLEDLGLAAGEVAELSERYGYELLAAGAG